MRDADRAVASVAAAGLIDATPGPDQQEALCGLAGHRVAKVRAYALSLLAARFPAAAAPRLKEALFDLAPSVRDVARFELGKLRTLDLAATYAEAVPQTKGPRLLATLAGLAECGHARDAVLVRPFLDDPSNLVRCAAIRALTRLDGDAYASAFLDAIECMSPRLVRLGQASLRKRLHLVDRARLDALVAAGGTAARALLPLLPELDYWDALLAALRAAAYPDLREVADSVVSKLAARQVYSAPRDYFALEQAFALVRAHPCATETGSRTFSPSRSHVRDGAGTRALEGITASQRHWENLQPPPYKRDARSLLNGVVPGD